MPACWPTDPPTDLYLQYLPIDLPTYLLTYLPTYTYCTYLLNFIESLLCSMRFFMEKVMHVILAI